LNLRGIEAVLAGIRFGADLPREVERLIDDSDCLIAIGTSHALKSESQWVRKEMEYARSRRKTCFALLSEDIPETEIPTWFKEFTYVTCEFGDGWTVLLPYTQRLRQKMPLQLRTGVLLVFFLLFVVPALLLLLIQPRIGRASAEIRRVQETTEAINANIEAARKGENHTLVQGPRENDFTETWVNSSTGDLIAKDIFDSSNPTIIRQRHFFADGREFATDNITVTNTLDGSTFLLKIRQIYPIGNDELAVEDVFDSVGHLTSKRVRRGKNGAWRNYAELSSSVYPVFFAVYR
jgi:hypothetical protein